LRHHEEDALGHRRADQAEEGSGQIGTAPFARAGVHVELEERVPVLRTDGRTGDPFDRDIVAEGVPSLALDRLALARRERREKVVEGRESVAEKVELLAVADEEADALEPGGVLGGWEGHVDRGGFRLPAD